jgi:hypothetical protein
VRYAVQEDLWAHALIISSCVNKDLWMEVVHGFAERELATPAPGAMQTTKVVYGDRQGLRVLYALFAGQGAKAGKHCNSEVNVLSVWSDALL